MNRGNHLGHLSKRIARALGLGLALVWMCIPASAQICPLCYQNAAASGSNGILALRHGILILLIPALSMFGFVMWLLLRRGEPGAGFAPPPESEELEDLDQDGPLPFPTLPDSHHPARP